MSDDRSGVNRPRAISDALAELLRDRGLEDDVARAWVLEAWPRLVGPQIAGVTAPRHLTEDGVLVVAVKTHGWMQELSLMERSLLAKLGAGEGRAPVKKIRWELMR